jgi:hypothetical protein
MSDNPRNEYKKSKKKPWKEALLFSFKLISVS